MKTVPYQSAVGSLIHAAIMSRPDISYAVQQVAQYKSNPGRSHWTATKRIFRYLKGTRDYTLTLGGKMNEIKLSAYSDSDFGMSKDHGRSIAGSALFLGSGCFHWSSKKQQAVALSTPEAELYAAVNTGRDVIWMRQLLEELQTAQSSATALYMDANSAIDIMLNEVKVSRRTRHISIRHFWIREKTRAKDFIPEHVSSENNAADIFTKPLPNRDHQRLIKLLGMTTRTDTR